MKIRTMMVSAMLACSMLTGYTAGAETKFPDTPTVSEALKHAVSKIRNSDYKELEITTRGGTFSGVFVKQSGNVLILRRPTGNTNLKHNKEKILYMMVDVNSITGVSFHALD